MIGAILSHSLKDYQTVFVVMIVVNYGYVLLKMLTFIFIKTLRTSNDVYSLLIDVLIPILTNISIRCDDSRPASFLR